MKGSELDCDGAVQSGCGAKGREERGKEGKEGCM
jgi:hypothetical protein